MNDQICQFQYCNLCFIWRKSSSKNWIWFRKIFVPEALPRKHSDCPLCSPIFRSHPCGKNFNLHMYPYRFVAAFGTWVSVPLSIFSRDCDDISPWPLSKTIQLRLRDQLDLLKARSWTIEAKEPIFNQRFLQHQQFDVLNFPPHTNLSLFLKLMSTCLMTHWDFFFWPGNTTSNKSTLLLAFSQSILVLCFWCELSREQWR